VGSKPAGLVSESIIGQIAFPHSSGSRDEEMMMSGDPFIGVQRSNHPSIQPTPKV